ncbi:hypothetical protein V9K97_13675 [Variovorax sp. CCNWLW186]|uniref:hypothetical protein n=1 Tax=Variovorax sp. CCNWLW186 TaxID=3127473 RepID=UPI003077986E
MDELSPWNEATNFRLDEVACLIVGRQPLSNRRNPDREDLPAPAVPILVRLSSAYLGWLIHRDGPENPEWPKEQLLQGTPNFDGSQRTFLQVVGDQQSRDLRRICWEHVDRTEIVRWLQAVQMPSKFDFSPRTCGHAETPTRAPAAFVAMSSRLATTAIEGADGAPERETRQTASAPKFSMTKAALIKAHEHEWPSIRRDIQGASTNGLAEARAGARDWNEAVALDWARAKGKLESPAKAVNPLTLAINGMSNLPASQHKIQG